MNIWEALYKQMCDITSDAIYTQDKKELEALEEKYDAVIEQEPDMDLLDKYINGPWCCPKCRSTDIASSALEAKQGAGATRCQCDSCGTHWTEHWVLANIMIAERMPT